MCLVCLSASLSISVHLPCIAMIITHHQCSCDCNNSPPNQAHHLGLATFPICFLFNFCRRLSTFPISDSPNPIHFPFNFSTISTYTLAIFPHVLCRSFSCLFLSVSVSPLCLSLFLSLSLTPFS